MNTIAVAGTFDNKDKEFAYVKGFLEELGVRPFMIHTGVFEAAFPVDVNNDEIAAAVGQDIKAIVQRKDRALATETLSKGMEKLVPELYRQGKFDGIISFGGSGGTSLVTPAMRETMDALINAGFFAGVLDLTTTEWADESFNAVHCK